MSVSSPLTAGQVEVTRVDLRSIADGHAAVLSDQERARADRLRKAADRARWVAARSSLRRLLAGHLGIRPEELAFAAGPTGKPRLAAPNSCLRFNLSHSGDMALVAVAVDREVGADIERVRPGLDVCGIARRALEPSMAKEIENAPPDRRTDVFFRSWSRHEARLKCTGAGLSEAEGEITDDDFVVLDVPTPRGYQGAVAIADTARVRWRVDPAPRGVGSQSLILIPEPGDRG